ncbi:hypothetical protein HELRODRAFT_160130 [Helobdella robusta]|uniref:Uncharacterized protein n=1 Tax=Helobdella robusta TaxID=6412 RepID=T1EPU5_HELRO|nr:hypothetical protein HELRODRAFT_160130 [Helobdella robusta]ESO06017.1 hypothetical protein HELRODRAFT_160130 [Helobdella robusta]
MNYGWNERERTTAFVVALRGSAAEVFQTIPAENHSNYEVLRPGESIKQLAQDIEQLTLLSNPTYDPQHRKETALKTFVIAVLDSDLRQTLKLADKRNLNDAVAYRLIFEMVLEQNAGIVEKKDIYGGIVNNALEAITVNVQQHGTNELFLFLDASDVKYDSIVLNEVNPKNIKNSSWNINEFNLPGYGCLVSNFCKADSKYFFKNGNPSDAESDNITELEPFRKFRAFRM